MKGEYTTQPRPVSFSDIDAVRHQELSNYLRELRSLLIDIKELLADRERERLRFEGDHR